MMSDAELVKAGVDAALAPVKDTLNRLLGPLADELGGILADPVRVFRFKRSVRLLEKVQIIADDAGFQPNAVPLKTLLPILENASLEQDEELHDRWANLLANAAHPNQQTDRTPLYASLLRDLSATEVRFLDMVFDDVQNGVITLQPDNRSLGWEVQLDLIVKREPAFQDELGLSFLPNLERLNLVRYLFVHPRAILTGGEDVETLVFTQLAYELVEACRPPKEFGKA